MSVRKDIVEVVCDGPDRATECPGSRAWTDYGNAVSLRISMAEDGWLTAQRGGLDHCPDCRKSITGS